MASKKNIVPPPLVTKTRRDVEQKPTVGDEDTTDRDSLVLSKTRSDFRAEEFTRVIRQKGYFCIWRKAMICPCYNVKTNQAALNCTACGGSGYQYIDPTLIQCIMSRFDRKDDVYKHAGHFFSGTAKATTEPQYRLGYRDSLELRDSVITYNEYIFKNNREGRRKNLPANVDTARYRIVRVVGALAKTKYGDIIRLEQDQDFTITKDGHLKWTAVGDPKVPDGTAISLNYEIRPVYIVTSHSNILRTTLTLRKRARPTVEALPMQVDVMLDYLCEDTEQAAPVTEDGSGV